MLVAVEIGVGAVVRGRARIYLARSGITRTFVYVSPFIECPLSVMILKADADAVQLRWVYAHKDGRESVKEDQSTDPYGWREGFYTGFSSKRKAPLPTEQIEWELLQLSVPLQT